MSDPAAKTIQQKRETSDLDTINLAVLQYLKYAKAGTAEDSPKRYKQDYAAQGYYHGFSADDWFRGVWAFIFFTGRRDNSKSTQPTNQPTNEYQLCKITERATDDLRLHME